MSAKIFHTVNAGLYIESDKTSILIDGIHKGFSAGFSDMPYKLLNDMNNNSGIFCNIPNLLFTHKHPDHYNKELVDLFLKNSAPSLFCPGLKETTVEPVFLEKNIDLLQMRGLDILSINVPHEGECYKNTDNRSYLVSMDNTNIFIAGDSVIDPNMQKSLSKYIKGEIQYGFANIYQIIHPATRIFLSELHPKRLFLYHLPFKEDDKYNLHKITQETLKKIHGDFLTVETLNHMSWINL